MDLRFWGYSHLSEEFAGTRTTSPWPSYNLEIVCVLVEFDPGSLSTLVRILEITMRVNITKNY